MAYELDSNLFNPVLNEENLLRKIGELATQVEQDQKISSVECHVGKPTGPTAIAALEDEIAYLQHRLELAKEFERTGSTECLRRGYDDHAGDPAQLTAAANALTIINRLDKGELNNKRVFSVNGGTGGLNVAVSLWDKPTVLVPEPYYPPWKPIIARNNGNMVTFPLSQDDNYLLNFDVLDKKIAAVPEGKPVVLLYHYPNNPVGKTLTREEADKVAKVLSALVAKYHDLILIQEDLYLGTIRSDKAIYTPLPYLSPEAKQHTLWIHSPSKEGLGMSRAALIATFSDQIAALVRKSSATFTLGMGSESLVATVATLTEIAKGGVEARQGGAVEGQNHRYVTADYYQERMTALATGFHALEKVLGQQILYRDPKDPNDNGVPQGTYYLTPSLAFMKGQKVPDAFKEVVGRNTIETTADIKMMLAHAYKSGLRPVTVAEGEIFTDKNEDFFIRLAAVDEDKNCKNLLDAANTLKGVIGMVMGKTFEELGVTTRTPEQLREDCPLPPAEIPALITWAAKFPGKTYKWDLDKNNNVLGWRDYEDKKADVSSSP